MQEIHQRGSVHNTLFHDSHYIFRYNNDNNSNNETFLDIGVYLVRRKEWRILVDIKGKVKYTITLDPSVWIFDDRKADLDSFFEQQTKHEDELEDYTKSISKHWDREIIEGANVPPNVTTKKKFIKEALLNRNFRNPF